MMVFFLKDRFPPGRHHKLKQKKYGPFCVLQRINDNAYVLDLPVDMCVSSTFNVSDLTAYFPPIVLDYPDHTLRTSSVQLIKSDVVANSNSESDLEYNLNLVLFLF